MRKQLIIEYNWYNVGAETFSQELLDTLENVAWDRISSQMKEGYKEGELLSNIRILERWVLVQGWWKVSNWESMD